MKRHIAVYVPELVYDDGFGTLVDNLIANAASPEIRYTVFRNWWGLMAGCMSGFDSVLFNGGSSGLMVRLLKAVCRTKLIVRIGRAGGYSGFSGKWQEMCEGLAVKNADVVVTDNRIVLEYLMKRYGRLAELIPNGGDHMLGTVSEDNVKKVMEEYGLEPGGYAIAECRTVTEDNCRVILDAFSRMFEKIVFVGDWEHNGNFKYPKCPNIRQIAVPEDPDELYVLRSCSRLMLHGYGAGDTTPSLSGLMWFGKPVICLDSGYNREITRNQAYYFTSAQDIVRHVFVNSFSGKPMLTIASAAYVWKHVARQYETIYEK